MLILWSIRYLNREDRQFASRWLTLDIATIDPATRAAIEFVIESSNRKSERDILRFRKHFVVVEPDFFEKQANFSGGCNSFSLLDYFEDEAGSEITLDEMGKILTGNPNTRLIPSGFKQHDVEYMLAEPKPVPVAEITLTPDDFKLLGYFVRDSRELSNSAFMADGPGTLHWVHSKSSQMTSATDLKTSASDDEIRSFVTVYRRLYMTGELANFVKAVGVIVRVLGIHPLGKWLQGVGDTYESAMGVTGMFPFRRQGNTTFTSKNLIDALIYTQYAHQPLGKNEHRQQEWDDYLRQLNGDKGKLTWQCLSEIWKSAGTILNAARVIDSWFERYCQTHETSPDVLTSLQIDHPGIGSQEKEGDRRTRVLQEKIAALADAIWKQRGSPAGGSAQFLHEAEVELKKQLGEHKGKGEN